MYLYYSKIVEREKIEQIAAEQFCFVDSPNA